MIKKIKIEQLDIGMFVHDFNCGWLAIPFFRKRLLIENEEMLRIANKAGIKELYIDTEKGDNVSDAPDLVESAEMDSPALQKIQKTAAIPKPLTPVQAELEKAQEIHESLSKSMNKVLHNVLKNEEIQKDVLESDVNEMIASIRRNPNALTTLGMVRGKDEYTFEHSLSVGTLMLAFGNFLGYRGQDLLDIGTGSILHDVGKMKVDLKILNKPAKLTHSEYEHMQMHVVYSRKIIEKIDGISQISLDIAALHHERIDGKGYPNGFTADQLSEAAKMSGIVDVYDAITADRVYHKGMSPFEAIQKIYAWSKYHLDRTLVEKFIKFIGVYPVGSLLALDSGRLGVVIHANGTTPIIRVIYNTRTNRYIVPVDIDLSKPNAMDNITEHASAEKWGINVKAVLKYKAPR